MRAITKFSLILLIVLAITGRGLLGLDFFLEPVKNVTSTADETGSITTTWDPVEGSTEYGVQVSEEDTDADDHSAWDTCAKTSETTAKYTDGEPGTSYDTPVKRIYPSGNNQITRRRPQLHSGDSRDEV